MRSSRRPMHKPLPAVFPSVGSCRLCTNLFLFFNFTVFARGSCPKITGGAWASAHFLFLPLCPPLWGMRSSRRLMRKPIPAVFPSVGSCRLCTNIFCFSILLFSLAGVLSRAPAVLGNPRRLMPTLAPSSRTCLLCWRPRGLHRATSDNCR